MTKVPHRPQGLTEKYVIAIRVEDANGSGTWIFGGDDKPQGLDALARAAKGLINEVGAGLVKGRATCFVNTDAGWRRWAKEQRQAKNASDMDAIS